MKIGTIYNNKKVHFDIPDKNLLHIVEPNNVHIGDPDQILEKAIRSPINSKPFSEFMAKSDDVLFIVNDATRPTPTARVLDYLESDIDPNNCKFIVATGAHRAPTEEEMKRIFGRHLDRYRNIIHIHDARDESSMVSIGTSRSGTEMQVNRLGVEAGSIFIIGSVEPHYFAGLTGGRKAFLPGIASYKTIQQNHFHALNPTAQPLALDGNAVHDDMIDALKTIEDKAIFSVMTVFDKDRNLYAATAGHLHDSFYEAAKRAWEVFAVEIQEKADIVISIAAPPMDIDFNQVQKLIENGKLALKKGGTLIALSSCHDGFGEEAFSQLISSEPTPESEKLLHKMKTGISRDEYKLGYHKGAKIFDMLTWADIKIVSDLPHEPMKRAGLVPEPDIQTALDNALNKSGHNASVIVLTDGSITIPVLKEPS